MIILGGDGRKTSDCYFKDQGSLPTVWVDLTERERTRL
jgi:hypothetical protein